MALLVWATWKYAQATDAILKESEKCGAAAEEQAAAAQRSIDLLVLRLEDQLKLGRGIVQSAVQSSLSAIAYWKELRVLLMPSASFISATLRSLHHRPSIVSIFHVLLIFVPFMPTLKLAIAVLLLRFSISRMDVPTRQPYTMAVVSLEERSAAAGITVVARTTGAAISPFFAGLLFARPSLMNVPFYLAGALKIVYDVSLYRAFARSADRGRPVTLAHGP